MTNAIDAESLTKSYGRHTVLDRVSLRVGQGEVFALLGPNGAGKTTTIGILSTLIAPDSGSARVAGFDVERERSDVTRRIALTGQFAAVDDVLTGRENLVMIGRLRGLGRSAAKDRAARLLDRFGLTSAAGRPVATYSGGMRRRLDLALSFVTTPHVLFLDEPTTGLDTHHRRELWDVIRSLSGAGVTVMLTTQYLEEADELADRIAVLDDGRIVAEGTPGELKTRAGQARVQLRDHAGTVRIDAATDGTLRSVRATLQRWEADGLTGDVNVRRPTLDDVFHTLTGRTADEHDPTASPAKEFA